MSKPIPGYCDVCGELRPELFTIAFASEIRYLRYKMQHDQHTIYVNCCLTCLDDVGKVLHHAL